VGQRIKKKGFCGGYSSDYHEQCNKPLFINILLLIQGNISLWADTRFALGAMPDIEYLWPENPVTRSR
jgi:hypothetical protein